VALLDADIYGFSLHRLLGAEGQPEVRDGALHPPEVKGMKVMSMGFLVPEDTPLIWRGPMLSGALTQFLQDVEWGDPDFLLVDLPPGTGDVPLTLAQRLPAARVLLVTTPEPLAVSVASRAAHFARKLGQEILGVVENMSYLRCPECRRVLHPLGQGGGNGLADALGVPVLARVPMLPSPLEGPVVETDPGSEPALAFRQLAREVAERLKSSPAVPKKPPAASSG
jgi:ATP-binding protein involved in chromosome partitioning